MKKVFVLVLLIVFIAVLLTFKSSQATPPRPKQLEPNFVLEAGQTTGQTFFSTHQGLNEVEVFLIPVSEGEGDILFTLLDTPQSKQPRVTVTKPVKEILQPGFYRFTFPARDDSYLTSYYMRFHINGSGKVAFQKMDTTAYYEGAMYENEQPVRAHLKFQTSHQMDLKLLGLLRQAAGWAYDIFLGVLLFLLPGWAILSLVLKKFSSFSIGEKLGLGAGVSIALYPVLFAWMDMIGFYPGPYFAWAVIAFDILFLIWAGFQYWQNRREHSFRKPICIPWDSIALLVAIGLVGFTRFWAIRTLPSPLGLDSVHHGAITQLILDHGGLFQSWLPYAPYKSFTTHFGFHVLAAVYSWISGKDMLQAILVIGQIANVLAVVVLYPLTLAVSGGKRWAGVGAVVAAGLISPMPAFYVNWGRYPQLIGMLILPAALWFVVKAIAWNKQARALVPLGGLTLAGMFLSYYRLPFLYAPFVAAWLFCLALTERRRTFRSWLAVFARLALVAAAAAIMISPWLGRIMTSRLTNEEIHGTIKTVEQVILEYQKWKDVLFHVPLPLMITALLGVAVSVVRGNIRQLSPLLWIFGLLLVMSLALLNVPGADLMQTGVILISVYVPVCMLTGILIAQLQEWFSRPSSWQAEAIFALLVVLVGLTGVSKMSLITSPKNHGFLTWADLRALTWVQENLPEDARFLVETQRFKETSAIGGDAGWWLPILTGRQSNMPPQYALVMEYPYEKDYNQKVVDWTFYLEEYDLNKPEGIQVLCKGNFDYVYMGEKIFYTDRRSNLSFFTIDELASSPDLTPVYQQDLISIYKLRPGACEGISR